MITVAAGEDLERAGVIDVLPQDLGLDVDSETNGGVRGTVAGLGAVAQIELVIGADHQSTHSMLGGRIVKDEKVRKRKGPATGYAFDNLVHLPHQVDVAEPVEGHAL